MRDQRQEGAESRASVGGSFGFWMNKRALTFLEIRTAHEIVAETGGWRLNILEAGKLIARHGDGRQGLDVEAGDFLLSSGDDFYLALKRERPGKEPDREDEDDNDSEDSDDKGLTSRDKKLRSQQPTKQRGA